MTPCVLPFASFVHYRSLFVHVIVSEPFRSMAHHDSSGNFVQSLFLSSAFKMQWSCVPSPCTSVRWVSLFYFDHTLHAAGSWKSDYHNPGKLKFFALDEKKKAGAHGSNSGVMEKATVEFPSSVSVLYLLHVAML